MVPCGVNVLELDGQGRIAGFAAMWDGARADDSRLLQIASAVLEP
jgi:hypothetical protein